MQHINQAIDFSNKAIDFSRGIRTSEVRKNIFLKETEEVRLKNFAYFPGAILLCPIYAVYKNIRFFLCGPQRQKWTTINEIMYNFREDEINNLVLYKKTRSLTWPLMPDVVTKSVMAAFSGVLWIVAVSWGFLIYSPVIKPLFDFGYAVLMLCGMTPSPSTIKSTPFLY